MREARIKSLLRSHIAIDGCLCVEELPICGHAARADLVKIDVSLTGFEIKSEYDSLKRLARQCEAYDRVFEYSSLVVAKNHLEEARKIIPNRWGIIEIRSGSEELIEVRHARPNKEICGSSISEFFWQRELVDILSRIHTIELRKSWSRKRLREEAVLAMSPPELLNFAAAKMRFRQHWRAA